MGYVWAGEPTTCMQGVRAEFLQGLRVYQGRWDICCLKQLHSAAFADEGAHRAGGRMHQNDDAARFLREVEERRCHPETKRCPAYSGSLSDTRRPDFESA